MAEERFGARGAFPLRFPAQSRCLPVYPHFLLTMSMLATEGDVPTMPIVLSPGARFPAPTAFHLTSSALFALFCPQNRNANDENVGQQSPAAHEEELQLPPLKTPVGRMRPGEGKSLHTPFLLHHTPDPTICCRPQKRLGTCSATWSGWTSTS